MRIYFLQIFMKISVNIQEYLDFILIDLSLSKATLDTYQRQLNFFLNFLTKNNIDITTFTEEDVHEYIRFIQAKKNLSVLSNPATYI